MRVTMPANCNNLVLNNIAVFSEKTDVPPPPKPVHSDNFSHKAVTLKTRSRSPKSNKLLILSDLYSLANLVTFHVIVHEITWLKFGGLNQGHQNLFSFLSCPNVISMQI